MDVNFNKPQRQSPLGVAVLFVNALQKNLRVFWPLILFYAFKFKELNKLHIAFGVVIIVIVIGIISYLKYRNFTFFLDSDKEEFIISEGILNKTKTAIQLNRIQQVSINQSFIQKIIGIYELQVDTAGSSKKEGNIKAISYAIALELKSRLLNQSANIIENQQMFANPIETEQADTEKPFVTLSLLSLLKLGLTSNYRKTIALIMLFIFTIYDNFKKFGDDNFIYQNQVDSYIDQSVASNSNLIGIIFIGLIVLFLNIIRVIIQYYGYTISRQKDSLLLAYGLFNSKNTILKPEKVQIAVITRNFFQKKLGILELKIKQATSKAIDEGKSVIEIPGCTETENESILKLLYNQLPQKEFALQPNYRKLIVAFSVFLIIPLTIYTAIGNLNKSTAFDYIYYIPIYIIIVGTIQYFQFKNDKLYISENFIIKQSGAWDISTEIIEPHKIQSISISQYFWHKKPDLGSIILHTAGGDLTFQMGNYSILKSKVNLWLYQIEKSDSNWM